MQKLRKPLWNGPEVYIIKNESLTVLHFSLLQTMRVALHLIDTSWTNNRRKRACSTVRQVYNITI